jgi:hypothetical protein
VKVEILTVAKESGFQDVIDADVVELLECHSLPLMNEELAEFERQTHKEAQDNHGDESVISQENTLTI